MDLNEKLARWAFKTVEERYGSWNEGDFYEMQSNPYSEEGKYHRRQLCFLLEGRELTANELEYYKGDYGKGRIKFVPERDDLWEIIPDFIESLDACFKYLVPKLWEEGRGTGNGVQIFLRQCDGKGWTIKGWMCSLHVGIRIANIEGLGIPALALCKAIEKLVGG